jgi:hypothetical protein
MQLNTGREVFHDAMPAPIAGCRMNHGAATVAIPISSAGHNDGDRAHSRPQVANKKAEKVIPIA